MPRENAFRPFTPEPGQMARWPAVSGNSVNGLGEREFRRARTVYWATDPSQIAHDQLQEWFFTVDPGLPEFDAECGRRREMIAAPLAPLAETARDRKPEAWTAQLDRFVEDGSCEKIGVGEMDPAWVLEGHDISQTYVIMAGVKHDCGEISKAPAPEAGAEVMRPYNHAALVSKEIAGWLRSEGWAAEPVTGPTTGPLLMVPAALACGFGELGKHGSIIDPEMGASFCLSAVLTDAPFSPTAARDYGIDAFCTNCRICEDACPPEALSPVKHTVRGTKKWYVDFDRCLPFFNQTQGCSICIAVCPWSRPGVGPNLAAKLARRTDRLSSD